MHGDDEKRPRHKVTKAEVLQWNASKFAVRFEFDDGTADYAFADTLEQAEGEARDRLGEEMPVGTGPRQRSKST
jgi:hypothetical protein